MSKQHGRRALHGKRPNVGELPLREDVRREIEAHISMRAEELECEGWDAAEALAEARRRFGDEREVRKRMERETRSRDRAVRRSRIVEGIWQDLRFATRTAVRSPGFTGVALITLALGIGANTAIFSVVHGVLLRPLPYEDPHELVDVLEWSVQRSATMSVAWPNFVDWDREARGFEGLAAYNGFTATVLGGEEPVRVTGAGVSQDFWTVFPVIPLEGRVTGPADHTEGSPPVVVVSEELWKTELGGRPIESLQLTILGLPVTVVGVVSGDFGFPGGARFWFPTELNGWGQSRTAHNLNVVGRLADGESWERADEELDRITRNIVLTLDEDPEYLADEARVIPLRDRVIGDARAPLILLLAAAGLVLLAACTNLASALLARGASRVREFAIRASVGAERGRMTRQLLTEASLMSLVGAALGVLLAATILPAIRAFGPASIPRLDEVTISAPVLAFTAAVAALTAIAFGLFPALRLSSTHVGAAMRDGDRGSANALRGSLWRLLVGTEVALALILLVGSALMVRSIGNVVREDRGFDPDDVMTAYVGLDRGAYPDGASQARWMEGVLEELAASPGVASAGLISSPPLGFMPNGRLELDGDLEKTADAIYLLAGPGTFEAMDVTVEAGRGFSDLDRPESPHVAIVSRSFADLYWPGEDPLGRTVTGGGMDGFWSTRPFATVVGVVEDVQYRAVTADIYPVVYFPFTQRPSRILNGGATLLVESATGDPTVAAPLLREVISRNEPNVPLQLRTLHDRISQSVSGQAFILRILGGFSLLTLLLAAVGIYGVVGYAVARRTREMGIRLALGASPSAVRGIVLRSALSMVLGGVLVGALASYFAVSVLDSQLYDVNARDPLTFFAVVAVLLTIAVLSSWLPAQRTTAIDPAVTMKAE